MAIILPQTLAKVLTLAVNFLIQVLSIHTNLKVFCREQVISTVLDPNEIQADPTVGMEIIHICLYLVPNLTKLCPL